MFEEALKRHGVRLAQGSDTCIHPDDDKILEESFQPPLSCVPNPSSKLRKDGLSDGFPDQSRRSVDAIEQYIRRNSTCTELDR